MMQRNSRKNLEMRLVCSLAMAVAAFTFIYGGKTILTRIQTSSLSSGYNAHRNDDATFSDRNLHSHTESNSSGIIEARICHSNIIADPGQFHEPLTVIFYMFGVFYLMIFINVVCEEYFVETVHKAVDILEIPESAAGATIMAAGSSMPELMAGLVGYTFKEAEDAGVGTVVGSLIFNSLFIVGASVWVSPAQKIGIDPFALLRDSIFYIVSVLCALVAFGTGQASWVISLCLMLLYILYVAVNMNWSSIEFQLRVRFPALGDAAPESVKAKSAQKQLSEFDDSGDIILDDEEASGQGNYLPKGKNPLPTTSDSAERGNNKAGMSPISPAAVEDNKVKSVGVIANACTMCMGVLVRPIKALLYYTVPRFLKAGTLQTSRGNWWILAQMCVSLLWLSIAVFFMIEWAEKAGCLIGISSSLMGLTVLAIGTSTPDAMASLAVARQGSGAMSISNVYGSNIFDILIALGLPWFIASLGTPTGIYPLKSPAEEIGAVVILFVIFIAYLIDLVYINKMELTLSSAKKYIAAYVVYIIYCIVLDVWSVSNAH